MIRKSALLLVALVILVSGSARGEGRWVYVGLGTYGSHYLDSASVRVLPSGYIQFWSKIEYTAAGLVKFLPPSQNAWMSDADIQNFRALKYSLALYVYDRNSMRSCLRSLVYYRADGSVIDSIYSDSLQWTPIPPDTLMDKMHQTVESQLSTRP